MFPGNACSWSIRRRNGSPAGCSGTSFIAGCRRRSSRWAWRSPVPTRSASPTHDATINYLLDLMTDVQTVRSCQTAAERDPQFTAAGYCYPNECHLAAGSIAMLKARPGMSEMLRIVPGSSLVVAPGDTRSRRAGDCRRAGRIVQRRRLYRVAAFRAVADGVGPCVVGARRARVRVRAACQWRHPRMARPAAARLRGLQRTRQWRAAPTQRGDAGDRPQPHPQLRRWRRGGVVEVPPTPDPSIVPEEIAMTELSPKTRDALMRVGTSTLTGALQRRGLRSMFMQDVWPVRHEHAAHGRDPRSPCASSRRVRTRMGPVRKARAATSSRRRWRPVRRAMCWWSIRAATRGRHRPAISMSGGWRRAVAPASSPTAGCAIPKASSRPVCRRTTVALRRRRARSRIIRAISICRSAAVAWRCIRATSSSATATASWSSRPTSSMKSRKKCLATTLYEEFAEEEVARGASSGRDCFPVAGDEAKRDFEAWKARLGTR